MPEMRKAPRQSCSFCGEHKDDVPLIVTSNMEDAACCCTCALAIVNQAFVWMGKVDQRTRTLMRASKAPPASVTPPEDATQKAIEKANGSG